MVGSVRIDLTRADQNAQTMRLPIVPIAQTPRAIPDEMVAHSKAVEMDVSTASLLIIINRFAIIS
jgi:hypothetical protein